MTRKNIKLVICSLICTIVLVCSSVNISQAATSYTLKPTSKTYKNLFVKNSTYNKYTKQYYMLRSYLERLESKGGGTLILTKGQYVITNTLYVPSNVTIILNNGATIVKGTKTGTSKLSPSKSLFQIVSKKNSNKNGSTSKYTGSKNVKIIGKGNAAIDLKNYKNSVGIVAGHNNSLRIEGITFKNMYDGNFIRVAGSTKVTITKNKFSNSKASSSKSAEAIKLSVPDKTTGDFNYTWSKLDKTPNKTVTISDNTFTNLDRAIGSKKYTQDVYNESIVISNNSINKTRTDAIQMLNWKNTTIEKNTIKNVDDEEETYSAIVGGGVVNPTIRNNTIENVARPMQFMPEKNTLKGSDYAITYNTISSKNITNLKNNVGINLSEYYIYINKEYNEFDSNIQKVELNDNSTQKDFIINPHSSTYRNKYINYASYNESTKEYYLIRSYLERLEKLGGGTLTLERGTYVIPTVLYIPSDVTIYFNDGVKIEKGDTTNGSSLKVSNSIFQLVSPSKASKYGIYGQYDGEKDINFIGRGNVIIDLKYYKDSLGIMAGHNQNIRIENIKFQNMYSGHFIELDATYNATIINNQFINSIASDKLNKEAINIDTPDREIEGWHNDWSNYDKTPNKNITIENNKFYNLDRAIGTHKYSQDQYHENVIIKNNTIDNTRSDAIRIMNWKNPIIENNVIKNIDGTTKSSYRGILASGVINPLIQNNTFDNIPRTMQFMPWKNSGPGEKYEITYNQLSEENKKSLINNKIINVKERFIRINNVFGVFDNYTEKLFF